MSEDELNMEWRDAAVVSMGVWERPFFATRPNEKIPGILWMPEEPAKPLPLVLIGHGGKSEKRNAASLAIARRFVRRHGIAVCAIDAINHGERGPIVDTGDGPPQAGIPRTLEATGHVRPHERRLEGDPGRVVGVEPI